MTADDKTAAPISRACVQCSASFVVSTAYRRLLERVSPAIGGESFPCPIPDLCPPCREQRRLIFRNERVLYRRSCSHTGKPLVSVYPAASPYTVYDPAVWWGDEFDATGYGRDIDFTRPFFAQFGELLRAVPKLGIHHAKSENCAYTNYSAENKNCYLVVGGLEAEDCYYSYRIFYSRRIVDCYDLYRCELCYECTDSSDLYGCRWSRACHSSSDLTLCSDLIGCTSCFGCSELRNTRFCIFNESVPEHDYARRVEELLADFPSALQRYEDLCRSIPQRANYRRNCESCTGDYLIGCKDCENCFTFKNSRECFCAGTGENNTDCADTNFTDNCELQFFSSNLEKNYSVLYSVLIWYSHDIRYSHTCMNSSSLFGCTGMKRNSFCILNRQYTEGEYYRLARRLAAHMRDTGEWGSFFPAELSPFSYWETVAHDYYPLDETAAHAAGFRWERDTREREVSQAGGGQSPACGECGKPFRIIDAEGAFYETLALPTPSRCPACRHRRRMGDKFPRRPSVRACSQCGVATETLRSSERYPLIVCERCLAG